MATKTKKLIILLIIFAIASLGTVNAENNTTIVDNPIMVAEDAPTVEALENGDSNISFTNGYKGYCIEWGEHSATVGDEFQVNNDVDNNIKTFFVYFYNESQKDVIATQHMIWKFTDNKEFSRFNKTLYNQIIEKSSTVQVPNDGFILFGENQKMIFSFRNFISEIEEYQNYFGYKIFFENNTNDINETIINNINTSYQKLQNFTSQIVLNKTYVINDNNSCFTDTSNNQKRNIILNSHDTGIGLKVAIVCLINMVIVSLLEIKK